ncbi:MAG: hypothetical protein A2096_08245 [Spirochaetes bacterium GWF1_41_5]|nr:MAG: hypothetical protein A2096_08245 [Spirochaetes bacterium GWF1_41_5]
MKNKILVVLFVFSGIVNIAVLTTAGYHWLREKKCKHKNPENIYSSQYHLYRELDLSELQIKEMELIRKSLEVKVDENQKGCMKTRLELIKLFEESVPDRKRINEVTKEIASRQKKMQELVIDNLIRQKKILTPRQQKKFFSIISIKLCANERYHNKVLLPVIKECSSECNDE